MTIAPSDVICFSDRRWSAAFERPHHLMSCLARHRRVFFVEPSRISGGAPRLERDTVAPNVAVLSPHLPPGLDLGVQESTQRTLLRGLRERQGITLPMLWFYTSAALPLAQGIHASTVVYDRAGAGVTHTAEEDGREDALRVLADVVFVPATTGASDTLNAYAFPTPGGADATSWDDMCRAMLRTLEEATCSTTVRIPAPDLGPDDGASRSVISA